MWGGDTLDLIEAVAGQVRIVPGGVTVTPDGQMVPGPARAIGLDFASVYAFAGARGHDLSLFTELLPTIEPMIVRHFNGDDIIDADETVHDPGEY